MKIAFVRPNLFNGKSKDAMEPLVFALLKSLTPKEIETNLYDDRIEDLPEELEEDIVAMTVETFTARRAYKLAKKYKKQGKYILMGGYHPTFMPYEALEYADTIFIGEAENTWKKFLDDFKNNESERVYKQDLNLDIKNIIFDESIFQGKKYAPIIPVQYGRGCKFNCEYCSISAFYKSRQNFRCLDNVISEIVRKKSKYLFITDDNLFQNKKKLKEFCNALVNINVKWGCQISIDIANDEKLLKLMKKSGCISVLIGFETLNYENLKQMKKTINLKTEYEKAVKKINSAGIMIYGTFIFGYDNDIKDSFKQSLDFSIKNKLFLANFNPLMTMPGTELYKRLKKENRLIYDKWWLDENYKYGDTMFYPKGMSPEELKKGCFETRKEFNKLSNISYRFFNTGSNIKNPFIYWGVNLINRKEMHNKQGAILGEKMK